MAQATDYNLANQTGADFRAELNEILAASVSLNSGSSEPTTMYAHQLWVDTSSNVLKIRNAANNAWLTTGVSITASNTFDINAGTINGITSLSFSSGATVASILDEDNLSSDSATALATQQSIKAYVDSQVTAQDLDITDGSSTIAIDLDSETLSLLGGTGITSTASGNGVTFAIGQSVATSDNVVFNQVTGALVGNASTATTLATARTISGVSFDGSANITLDTDDIGEGSNKYFTAERVDDQVNTLLTAGANISLTYNDTAGTLTIANTNSADITSVVAGDGLTGGGTSGAVTLAVGVDDSSIEINSDALRVKASGITNAMLGGSIANNKLANSSVTINSNSLSLGGTLTLDTDDIGEGSSNLYYTDARANSAIDARVTNTFINNLSGVVADTATALATARTIALSGDVAGSVSFDGTSDVTISSTIQANSVALGTDTTGNYVATITGTANKVSVSGSGSETAGVTLSLPDDVQIADSLTVAGNLTVNGTLTSLDTTNLDIEDNLFQLNAGLTGSPVNDSGMLINRGNQNNGIFMWDESADKFTMGLTTADGTSTGNITLASLGTLVANLEGNVTGDVTGNVSGTAATVTGAAQTAITSVGTLTGLTTTGDINLGDNDKVIFGAGSDLQIYHDGSDSYIKEDGTGNLIIAADDFRVTNVAVSEVMIGADTDGTVTLYHNGSTKLATTSTGIDVTGNIANTSGDLTLDVAGDIILDADGGDWIFKDAGTTFGSFTTSGNKLQLIGENNNLGLGAADALILNVSTNSLYPQTNNQVDLGFSSSLGFRNLYLEGNATIGGAVVSSGAKIVESSGATLDINTNFNGADSKILLHEGSSASPANGASIRYDGANNLFKIGVGSSVDTTRLTIARDTGNLGLGTDSPARNLSIVDTSAPHIQLALSNDQAASNGFEIAYDGSANYIAGRENVPTLFTTNNTEKMRIDTSGNLGLGTSSPNSYSGYTTLTLNNATNGGAIEFENNGTRVGTIFSDQTSTILKTVANVPLLFGANDAEKMRIDSSGNLGLGTSLPAQRLHVAGGQARFDDHISIQPTKKLFLDGGLDTYIDEVAANTIAFNSGGAERLRITSGGNVQIADSGKLVTKKTSGEVIRFERSTDDLRYSSIHANSTDGGGAFIQFKVHTGASATSTADVMTLMGSGRVGIGTSSPATPLHIESTSIPQLRVAYDGSNYQNISYEGSDIYGGSQTFKIAGSEKMRLDSSGSLGISETSPDNKLHVNSGTSNVVAKFESTDSVAAIQFKDNNGEAEIGNVGNDIGFFPAGAEKMRLDGSGNLLVGKTEDGTSNAGHVFFGVGAAYHIRDGGFTNFFNRTSSDGEILRFAKDGTTVGNIGARAGDLTIGTGNCGLIFNDGTEIIIPANITTNAVSDANVDLGYSGGRFKDLYLSGNIQMGGNLDVVGQVSSYDNVNSAYTTMNLRATDYIFKNGGGSEKMRLDSSGNLLVGKTTPDIATDGIELGTRIEATADGSYPLRVNRRNSDGTIIEIRKDGGSVGSISVTASATAYNTSSDARLKDVTGEARGLEVINELNPVAYNWKADSNADEGLIAQEVMDVVPNAVSGSEEDMYQMDYSKLVVHLVKAVQELKAEIDELKGE